MAELTEQDIVNIGLQYNPGINRYYRQLGQYDGTEPVGFTLVDGQLKETYVTKGLSEQQAIEEHYRIRNNPTFQDYKEEPSLGSKIVTGVSNFVDVMFTTEKEKQSQIKMQVENLIPKDKIETIQKETEGEIALPFTNLTFDSGLQTPLSPFPQYTADGSGMAQEIPMDIGSMITAPMHDVVTQPIARGLLWVSQQFAEEYKGEGGFPRLTESQMKTMTEEEQQAYNLQREIRLADIAQQFDKYRTMHMFSTSEENYRNMIYKTTGVDIGAEAANYLTNAKTFSESVVKVVSENAPFVLAWEAGAAKIFANNQATYKQALDWLKSKEGKNATKTKFNGDPAAALIDWAKSNAFKNKHFNKKKAQKFFANTVKYGNKVDNIETQRLLSMADKRLGEINTKIANTTDPFEIEKLFVAKSKEVDNIASLKNNLRVSDSYRGVVTNTTLASTCGGALYNSTGSEGYQIIGELSCGLLPVSMLKAGVASTQFGAEVVATTADRAGAMIDGINPFFSMDLNLRAKVLGGDFTDLFRYDNKGNYRPLTNKEIKSMKRFVEVIDTLPPQLREQTLLRMKTTFDDLEELTAGMDEASIQLFNGTLADLSGLAVLHGLEELSQATMNARKVTGFDVGAAQNRINQIRNLGDMINTKISQILKLNPDLVSNGRYKKFEANLTELTSKIQDDLIVSEQELLALHVEELDLIADIWARGDLKPNQMQEQLSLWQNKLAKLGEDTANVDLKSKVRIILEENKWEDDILNTIEKVNSNLMSDSFTKQFLSQGLEFIDAKNTKLLPYEDYKGVQVNQALVFTFEAHKAIQNAKVDSAYNALREATKIKGTSKYQTVDVTDTFDAIMDTARKSEPDLSLAKLNSAIPSNSDLGKMIQIFDIPAQKEITRYLRTGSGSETIAELARTMSRQNENIAFSDEFFELLQKDKLTQGDINKIKQQLKVGVAQMENVTPNKVTDFDLFNLLRRDDSIDMRLNIEFDSALQFKSAINKLEKKAFGKADNTGDTLGQFYKATKNSLHESLLTTTGNISDDVKNLYINANEQAYINFMRFSRNGTLGKKWSETTDVQKKNGENVLDSDAKAKAVDMDGGKTTGINNTDLEINSLTHKLDINQWFSTKDISKIIKNEADAATLIGQFERIWGKYDPNNSKIYSKAGGDSGFYFDPVNDKEIFTSLQAIITKQFTNYILESKNAKIFLNEGSGLTKSSFTTPNLEKLLQTKGEVLDAKSIKRLEEQFTITGSDGKLYKLLDVDNALDLSISYDKLVKTTEYGQKVERRMIADLKNLQNKSRELVNISMKKKQKFWNDLSGADVAQRFGTQLKDEKTFVMQVVKYGKFDDLVKIMQETGTLKNAADVEDFRLMGKELVAKFIQTSFENNIGNKFVVVNEAATGTKKAIAATQQVPIKEFDTVALKKFLSENEGGLLEIFTKEELTDINKFTDLFTNIAQKSVDDTNFTGVPRRMSVESWISRFYSMNRDIISPQYVATESVLQKMRLSEFSLLVETIKNPDLPKIIIKMLESDKPPTAKEQLALLNLLKTSTVFSTLAKEFSGQQALTGDDTVGEQLQDIFGEEYLVDEKERVAVGGI